MAQGITPKVEEFWSLPSIVCVLPETQRKGKGTLDFFPQVFWLLINIAYNLKSFGARQENDHAGARLRALQRPLTTMA
jgi:hypothetical protein